MLVKLIRYNTQRNHTHGALYIDNKFMCYTLEDGHRDKKIYGETRVPAGVYPLDFRKVGGFHNKYTEKFGDMHKGMIELLSVPNFEYVLFHIGNSSKDSEGCILVGNVPGEKETDWISSSTAAYKEIYPIIAAELEANNPVQLLILDVG